MPFISGIEQLRRKLRAIARQAKAEVDAASVTVGYTQNYGLFVHENTQANHPVGQAKYLEQPAREKGAILGRVVGKAMKAGTSLEQALLLAGLRLQRESQLLVPVDTGALKASAFTSITRESEAAAEDAFAKSEEIRQRKSKRRKKNKR